MTRSLTMLEGGRMLLRLDGLQVLESADTGPVAFPGDTACEAELMGAASAAPLPEARYLTSRVSRQKGR
ncbi:HutD family protein [Paracoccus xiamenensis]|uniref:HutD family protein n=1 Tax=Paracoccus xiamenensis TaxID=2714901 RepID=UPI002E27F97B|nr:HutD family protein [Paracoccus xiamenensis]